MLSEPRRRETFPLDVVAFAVVVKRFLFIIKRNGFFYAQVPKDRKAESH